LEKHLQESTIHYTKGKREERNLKTKNRSPLKKICKCREEGKKVKLIKGPKKRNHSKSRWGIR